MPTILPYLTTTKLEMIQKEKLQSILEIAGAVCHELNQPLQVISGYSELLTLEIDEGDPLYQRIEEIQKQVDRMGMITGKLSRITENETKDYVNSKIIDIDKASKVKNPGLKDQTLVSTQNGDG